MRRQRTNIRRRAPKNLRGGATAPRKSGCSEDQTFKFEPNENLLKASKSRLSISNCHKKNLRKDRCGEVRDNSCKTRTRFLGDQRESKKKCPTRRSTEWVDRQRHQAIYGYPVRVRFARRDLA